MKKVWIDCKWAGLAEPPAIFEHQGVAPNVRAGLEGTQKDSRIDSAKLRATRGATALPTWRHFAWYRPKKKKSSWND
jgi:hypothetical protein